MAIRELLEDALQEPSIGSTPRFRWHATPVGIAALWCDGAAPAAPPFDMALEEGLQVGLVLLFHS